VFPHPGSCAAAGLLLLQLLLWGLHGPQPRLLVVLRRQLLQLVLLERCVLLLQVHRLLLLLQCNSMKVVRSPQYKQQLNRQQALLLACKQRQLLRTHPHLLQHLACCFVQQAGMLCAQQLAPSW
jgi:hypothetical protein